MPCLALSNLFKMDFRDCSRAWNWLNSVNIPRISSAVGSARSYSIVPTKNRIPLFFKVAKPILLFRLSLLHRLGSQTITASKIPLPESTNSWSIFFLSCSGVACSWPLYLQHLSGITPPRVATKLMTCFFWVFKDSPFSACFSVLTRTIGANRSFCVINYQQS